MSTTSSAGSSVALEVLIEYCAAYPVADTDVPRFLTRLCSGSRAIIDWRDLGLIAVLLDHMTSAVGAVPLEIVALRDGSLDVDLVDRLLEEAAGRVRALGGNASELALSPVWSPHRDLVAGAGYRLAYTDLDMICRNADWGQDKSLPAGWRWVAVASDLVDEYARVLRSGFSDIPGTFLPDDAEIRRYLLQPGIEARMLVDGKGMAVGVLRYTVPKAYIHAVTRAAEWRGRGVGRMLMDEARRRLAGKDMRLNVVDTNRAAVDLYRRCNFTVERETPCYLLRL